MRTWLPDLARRQIKWSLWFLLPPILIYIGTSPAFGAYTAHAASLNREYTLDRLLSAQGLATPYQLITMQLQNGPCHEADSAQAAFVQGAIINLTTWKIWMYDPLVINAGTRPAVQPQRGHLPICVVNGQAIAGYQGRVSLRRQICTISTSASKHQITLQCN